MTSADSDKSVNKFDWTSHKLSISRAALFNHRNMVLLTNFTKYFCKILLVISKKSHTMPRTVQDLYYPRIIFFYSDIIVTLQSKRCIFFRSTLGIFEMLPCNMRSNFVLAHYLEYKHTFLCSVCYIITKLTSLLLCRYTL